MRAGIGVALAIGVVGVGAYLRSGTATELVKQPAKLVQRVVGPELETKSRATENPILPTTPGPHANASAAPPLGPQPMPAKVETAEAQFYCGAETKKGTPCSRRVKGHIRCYQHVGMPAMSTSERSKTN